MSDFESKKERIKLNSEKIRERERKIKVVKMGILIMLIALIIMYFLLRIIFETGYFTISLDPEFAQNSGLIMYEKSQENFININRNLHMFFTILHNSNICKIFNICRRKYNTYNCKLEHFS